MADVYKFKVKLTDLEDFIWRDIEITSASSVAKLGYTILAAFEATGSHLFNINFNGKRYEIEFEEDLDYMPVIDPIKTKLSSLKLSLGDTLTMEYDYGASWEFSVELISVTEMKKGSGKRYPYVTGGKGKGLIEDASIYEIMQIIEKTNSTGEIPKVFNACINNEEDWDYRDFDLEYCNLMLKPIIKSIKRGYEKFDDFDNYENCYDYDY